jgi:hypothetical protein
MDTTLRCPNVGDDCALDKRKEDGGGRALTIALPNCAEEKAAHRRVVSYGALCQFLSGRLIIHFVVIQMG